MAEAADSASASAAAKAAGGGAAASPTWATVDLDALAGNARALRRHVGPRCRLLAVVKADGYGHGAIEVSRRLCAEGVEWLCVARPDEGIELRRAGIEASILVLGPLEPPGLEACVAFSLTPTLTDRAGLEALEKIGAARGHRLSFHLKVDTGMGRLGLQLGDLGEWLRRLERCKHVGLEGLFSHLASIESVRGEASRRQLEQFQAAQAAVQAAGHSPAIRHLAASSAVLDLPEAWLEAVRPGLALYGVHPSHGSSRIGLRPVMAVLTRVAVVRELPEGSALGYEGTFVTRRRTRIAVLPIGYGDGLPRAHSNRGCVILGGHRAPIVGLVSMDLTLVDVTDVPAVSPGDEVIIFGEEGRGRPLEEFARDAALSPYEILCGLGVRVPRLYREGGRVVATRWRSRQEPAPAPSTTAARPTAVP
jgi:alanine racemase